MRMILIRGLPGSGKSTLAQALKGPGGVVCEADDAFIKEGVYRFNPQGLAAAHAECQAKARDYASRRPVEARGALVVSNTFSQRWEMEPYLNIPVDHSQIIDIFDAGLDDAELAARCIHEVPEGTIASMRARWEHDWLAGDPRAPWDRK